MKNKGLLFLTSAVFLLGAYAYFGVFKKDIEEQVRTEKKSQIVTLKKDQIQKVVIQKSGETLVLSRSKNGWDISGPLSDEADNDIVESLLDQVVQEKAVDRISMTPAVDIAQYGFKVPLGSITFVDNKEEQQKILVSSQKNFEGLYFLRKNADSEILTSGDSWFSFLTKSAAEFLNLKLFRFLASQVDQIEIQSNQDRFSLNYKDAIWKSASKPELELDQNQVREILSQVSLAKGIELLKSAPQDKPKMWINFKGEKLNWQAFFFKDVKSKDWLVKITNPELSIRFGPQTLEKLTNLRLFDLRDKALPFQFSKEDVTQIQWKTALKSQKIKKLQTIWVLDPQDPKFELDPGSVTLLIDKLKNLKVYRYMEVPKAQSGLSQSIELKNDKDEVLFSFQWSEFKNHEGYAKTSLSKEVFMMDDAQVNQLGLHNLVKSKIKTEKAEL